MRTLVFFCLIVLLYPCNNFAQTAPQTSDNSAASLTEVLVINQDLDEPFEDRWSILFGFGTSLNGSANAWSNFMEDRGFGLLRSSSFFGIFNSSVQYPLTNRRVDLELRLDRQYRSHRAWGGKLQMINSGIVNGFSGTRGDLDVEFTQQSLELYHRWSSAPKMASSTSVYAGPGIHRVTYSFFDGPNDFRGEGTWSNTSQFFRPGLTGGVTLFPFRGRSRVIWGIDISYTYISTIKVEPQEVFSRAEPDGVTVRGGRINPSTLSIRFLVGNTFGRRKNPR